MSSHGPLKHGKYDQQLTNSLQCFNVLQARLITFFHLYFFSPPRDAVDNLFQRLGDEFAAAEFASEEFARNNSPFINSPTDQFALDQFAG